GPSQPDNHDILCGEFSCHASLGNIPGASAHDADRRKGITLVVTLYPIAIIVACSGKSDQLPTSHVTVAAIDRVGKKTFLGVLQEQCEESNAVDIRQSYLAGIDASQHLVLILW